MFELNLTAMNETTDHVGGANAGITFKTKTTRKITRKTNKVCNNSFIISTPYRNTITTVWSRHKRQPVRLSANPTIGFRFSKRFITTSKGDGFTGTRMTNLLRRTFLRASVLAISINVIAAVPAVASSKSSAFPAIRHKELWQDG